MTITTCDVSVELELVGDAITAKVCDANVAQWEEDLGSQGEYASQDELVAVVASVISGAAHDLAVTLVADLQRRTAVKAGT